MHIILMERISNLGDLGEEVVVKNGYARNYLIPTGKAVRSTRDNRAMFEQRRAELERIANAKLSDASSRAKALADRKRDHRGEGQRRGQALWLRGHGRDSPRAHRDGAAVSKSEVRMPDGVIRAIGEHEVEIHLYADIAQTVQVVVVAE